MRNKVGEHGRDSEWGKEDVKMPSGGNSEVK